MADELKDVLRLITRVQSDPRVDHDQADQLQKAKRELETVARSGKLERRRVVRAIKIIATVLLEGR